MAPFPHPYCIAVSKDAISLFNKDIDNPKILNTYLLLGIGDTIVQYDPGHAALPWAAVRFVLQVSKPNVLQVIAS